MKKEKILRNPYIRILIVICSISVFTGVIAVISVFCYQKLFTENRHFLLKNVVVKSSGYWNNKSSKIIKILGLKLGKVNLFNIKEQELKKKLISQKKYSIENADIYKELPDTLYFNITERIPRALLYSRNSDLIVDGNAVLVNKRYCINIESELPVITGFRIKGINASHSLGKDEIPYGRILFQLKPALQLISLINTSYPGLNIKLINLYNKNELTVFMPGPQQRKIVRVKLPFKYPDNAHPTPSDYQKSVNLLKEKLRKLDKLFRYLKLKKEDVRIINMLYQGQAVVKK
ncbi:MAG: hypothetical protein K9L78_04010 [Victivallales bacterium]|nr:hypothetical protein [Victivallales bacterium]MCF7889266.1 hypothetical protein [Victivallales bacterium]